MFHNGKVDNLDTNLGGYFELLFIMTSVSNLYTNLWCYFELSFVMTDMGNLDIK